MAYKNKNKNKKHIQSLQDKGWRAVNKIQVRIRKAYDSLSNELSTAEKTTILKRRGIIK